MARDTGSTAIQEHEVRGKPCLLPTSGPKGTCSQKIVIEHIRVLTDAASEACKDTLDRANTALKFAVEAGNWLVYARQNIVPKGDWMTWTAKNFPKVSYRSIQRYMLLSARYSTHVSSDELPFQTLRQAYIIAGVVSEPVRAMERAKVTEDDPAIVPATLSTALLPFLRWQRKVLMKEAQTASKARIEAWLKELEPPHTTYLMLKEMLHGSK
jgi:hypothetical protein